MTLANHFADNSWNENVALLLLLKKLVYNLLVSLWKFLSSGKSPRQCISSRVGEKGFVDLKSRMRFCRPVSLSEPRTDREVDATARRAAVIIRQTYNKLVSRWLAKSS